MLFPEPVHAVQADGETSSADSSNSPGHDPILHEGYNVLVDYDVLQGPDRRVEAPADVLVSLLQSWMRDHVQLAQKKSYILHTMSSN